jgi:hypothetical protein
MGIISELGFIFMWIALGVIGLAQGYFIAGVAMLLFGVAVSCLIAWRWHDAHPRGRPR